MTRRLALLLLLLNALLGCMTLPLPSAPISFHSDDETRASTLPPNLRKRGILTLPLTWPQLTSVRSLFNSKDYMLFPNVKGGYTRIKGIFEDGPLKYPTQTKSFLEGMQHFNSREKFELGKGVGVYDSERPAVPTPNTEAPGNPLPKGSGGYDSIWNNMNHDVDASDAERIERVRGWVSTTFRDTELRRQMMATNDRLRKLNGVIDGYIRLLIKGGEEGKAQLANEEMTQLQKVARARGYQLDLTSPAPKLADPPATSALKKNKPNLSVQIPEKGKEVKFQEPVGEAEQRSLAKGKAIAVVDEKGEENIRREPKAMAVSPVFYKGGSSTSINSGLDTERSQATTSASLHRTNSRLSGQPPGAKKLKALSPKMPPKEESHVAHEELPVVKAPSAPLMEKIKSLFRKKPSEEKFYDAQEKFPAEQRSLSL